MADGEAFALVVEDSFKFTGRGVAVIGRFTGGPGSGGGAEVVITAPGRRPFRAVLAGRAYWHPPGEGVPPEGKGLLLVRGVTREDVPVGAVLTLVPADERQRD